MRILILNQYFPPDPAPTGVLLAELGEHLAKNGHQVRYASAGQSYRGSQGRGGRLWRELRGLCTMAAKALRGPRPAVVLSATSPPCLLLLATLVAWRHRARSVHWVMDLYPELASALGVVKPPGLLWPLQWLMRGCYARTESVVVLDADMAEYLQREYGKPAAIIRPWVFAPMLHPVERAVAHAAAPVAPWRWMYSGNLGRAHEWMTLLEAQHLVEQLDEEIELVIQGGGPARAEAQAYAAKLGLERCQWRDYAPEAELPALLLEAQVCVATQRPSARGLLWPSKLGLLEALPRPIAWVGDPQGAIAARLQTRPGSGTFAPGAAAALAEWLLKQKRQPVAVPSGALNDARVERSQSLAAWLGRLVG